MSRRARIVFLVVVALQLAFPLGLVAWNEVQLARGYEVRLQTAPIDPRDLFRGNYVILSYEISRVQADFGIQRGDTVYVTLRKVGPRYMADFAQKERPDELPFIRGTAQEGSGEFGEITVDYGIGRYYIQEGTAAPYERAPFLYVDVKLDENGKPRIAGVLIPKQRRS